MEAFVAIEGFTLPSGFVLKEFAVIYGNNEYDHYLFAPPAGMCLTDADERTIRYTTCKLNNLSWTDGSTPYGYIDEILDKLKDYKIFTFSAIALRTLQRSLPTSVIINIQDFSFEMPNTLPNPRCFRAHNYRQCALAKAFAVKKFMES